MCVCTHSKWIATDHAGHVKFNFIFWHCACVLKRCWILKWIFPLHIFKPVKQYYIYEFHILFAQNENENAPATAEAAATTYWLLIFHVASRQIERSNNISFICSNAWWVRNCVWIYISSRFNLLPCVHVHVKRLIGFGQFKTVLIIVWLPTPPLLRPSSCPGSAPRRIYFLLVGIKYDRNSFIIWIISTAKAAFKIVHTHTLTNELESLMSFSFVSYLRIFCFVLLLFIS